MHASQNDDGVERDSIQVQRALHDAEKAVAAAQESVQLVPSLPSAYAPHPVIQTRTLVGLDALEVV